MAPFYGWGSTASRLELLRGGSLLFTTKFPEIQLFTFREKHFTGIIQERIDYIFFSNSSQESVKKIRNSRSSII